ncbi:GntR family transcriptional regulator [Salinicoccus sp. ID82-1]|uniref:GntR family transcriptional regulator n=1 Tax=Salinicoccus cyprini TaxID=2493691 RepID=A0A558ARY6_9STAP|nr:MULTISPECIES: GntR family transcriptional regulator [Salinicoccus]MCG1009599.1 GntR family transcriptional regulator [Salinicoccus sp. ID82-1]TVT27031.1 GntR family transcriptional regulator [Salinicoccus cyprini]
MSGMLNDKKPIFEQIKDWVSDQIIDGTLRPHDRIPSTNEIVQFYKVNHLTVAKGVNQLVEEGIIYKKRGVGMFVEPEARSVLLGDRKDSFVSEYLEPMMQEAAKLGFTRQEIEGLIQEMEGNMNDE